MDHRYFETKAPRKRCQETQRKPTNTTEKVPQSLAGTLGSMFSIVNPSRPSLLNKTLLTPLCSSHFFCFPNLFSFSFLWSGRARALPLRPTPPTPPTPPEGPFGPPHPHPPGGPFGPPSQPQRPKCTEHAYNFKYVYDVIFPV